MTKEQLKAYVELRRERDDLARRIEEIELERYSPRSQRLDGMPRGGSGENYVLEDRMDREDKLLELYRRKKAELDAALLVIEEAIEVLDPRERRLIRLHYIDGLTWEQVAVQMAYSWTQVHRIHGKALEKLKEMEAKSL